MLHFHGRRRTKKLWLWLCRLSYGIFFCVCAPFLLVAHLLWQREEFFWLFCFFFDFPWVARVCLSGEMLVFVCVNFSISRLNSFFCSVVFVRVGIFFRTKTCSTLGAFWCLNNRLRTLRQPLRHHFTIITNTILCLCVENLFTQTFGRKFMRCSVKMKTTSNDARPFASIQSFLFFSHFI